MKRPNDEQINMWYPRLFRTALRLTGNAETAADLTQQAFCKALSKWEQFEGNTLPTTWLHQILLNCLRDWARRKRTQETHSLNEWHLEVLPDLRDGMSDQPQRREQLAHLREAIEDLPQRLRPAFVATVLDGYSYQEAAELLSVPVGTIASRVYQARQQINAVMRQRFPEVES